MLYKRIRVFIYSAGLYRCSGYGYIQRISKPDYGEVLGLNDSRPAVLALSGIRRQCYLYVKHRRCDVCMSRCLKTSW